MLWRAMDSIPAEGLAETGEAWQAWSPGELAGRLRDVSVPWCVAAGWAVDLFRGEITREHEDLEIAVPAAGFGEIRAALPGLEFAVVGDGRIWPLDGPAYERQFQTWGRDPATGAWRLDVFREPHDGSIWICRRDESIRRPYHEIILTSADGIPYLTPEVVLLFKAKHRRPKDEADFAGTLPRLADAQRDWLGWALRRVHPGHTWLTAIES